MTLSTQEPTLPRLDSTGVDLVVLGATGDLVRRKLLPALASAEGRCLVPAGTRIIGLGRRSWDDQAFRAYTMEALAEHAPTTGAAAREALAERLSYLPVDVHDPAAWETLARALSAATGRTRVFYLACAPDLFGPVCQHLARVGLADDRSRVVLEKPLGHDLTSARQISAQVGGVFEERQVFRIDHYLGKETVQNLLVLRFGNAVFAPLWDARSIDHVQITVAETLGVGTRGGYYDTSGALRDMVQNHLLQLLCLIAMEPPARLDADGIRDAKVEVLRALRPWTPEAAGRLSVRGQYEGYRDECGNPTSTTETFAALEVQVDNWRWAGVPFYLRTGKRMGHQSSRVVVQLRDLPHWIFPEHGEQRPAPNQLVIGLQPDEVVHLELRSKVPGPGPVRLASRPLRLDLASAFSTPSAGAYERLLLDVLQDNPVLFMRRDEVEAAWTWIDPLLAAWRNGAAPLLTYPPGTDGPAAADALLARSGRQWHEEQRG
jgi:glucose-6-phosphate 1-dehydrogenase